MLVPGSVMNPRNVYLFFLPNPRNPENRFFRAFQRCLLRSYGAEAVRELGFSVAECQRAVLAGLIIQGDSFYVCSRFSRYIP